MFHECQLLLVGVSRRGGIKQRWFRRPGLQDSTARYDSSATCKLQNALLCK